MSLEEMSSECWLSGTTSWLSSALLYDDDNSAEQRF